MTRPLLITVILVSLLLQTTTLVLIIILLNISEACKQSFSLSEFLAHEDVVQGGVGQDDVTEGDIVIMRTQSRPISSHEWLVTFYGTEYKTLGEYGDEYPVLHALFKTNVEFDEEGESNELGPRWYTYAFRWHAPDSLDIQSVMVVFNGRDQTLHSVSSYGHLDDGCVFVVDLNIEWGMPGAMRERMYQLGLDASVDELGLSSRAQEVLRNLECGTNVPVIEESMW